MDVSVEKVFLWNEPTACFRFELSNSMCADYTLTYYSVTDLNILSFQMWKRKTSKKNSLLPFWNYLNLTFLKSYWWTFLALLKFNLNPSPVLECRYYNSKKRKVKRPISQFCTLTDIEMWFVNHPVIQKTALRYIQVPYLSA